MSSEQETTDNPFQRRLTTVTLCLLIVVLVFHLLREFATILQPLLIAILISYATLPPVRWLVKRGVRPALAYVLMLAVLLGAFLAIGQGIYGSVASLTSNSDQLDRYKTRLNGLRAGTVGLLQRAGLENAEDRVNRAVSEFAFNNEDIAAGTRSVAGSFVGFVSFALIVFVYLIFFLVERLTFPRKLSLAFGETQASNLLLLAETINNSIVQYIAVKTWISLVTAGLSLILFLIFGIEFAVLWAILIFLLNYVPYLGGIVAMAPPVALCFLQHGILIAVLLILALTGVQLFTGQFIEPRMAGQRLNLSPLLILISLAFWGFLWGVPGMLLAVPLTVVVKIVLDHIPETRPIGTLMSNL